MVFPALWALVGVSDGRSRPPPHFYHACSIMRLNCEANYNLHQNKKNHFIRELSDQFLFSRLHKIDNLNNNFQNADQKDKRTTKVTP